MRKCPRCDSDNTNHVETELRGKVKGRLIFDCNNCGTEFTCKGITHEGNQQLFVDNSLNALKEGFHMLSNDYEWDYMGDDN